ncbi:ABC transporter ATP-binding protein [Mesoplasma lactucae]|uniref:Multidrug ABC transporter ATP-binding protein n=1 Tax=Mesoplasma lactucae ATCC 49193 TaxID=81460 RepID=A0A291ISN5_9MOLU|nr:ABC transporter ATP-binding protein [Mesoplasma lactucae]ATG97754.1 multidrug ABC transporter ATP-binding protein [Mesoplasma lactucae ATCC 49193]ATZ20469.1 ABC transporter ATP-binding protein [Mesoplasma lactucae ATCC 49193]MCL8216641.1 Vitamin B12 import ATP-binding protein BtuD [Mesoplasma lactucae ATCC 49193]
MAQNQEPIVIVNNVHKSYPKKEVLKGLNLTVNRGDKIAVLGANGAGKSTLVDMIALTSKPTSGDIQINIPGSETEVKKEIGIQFQQGEWPAGITPKIMLNFYKQVFPRFTDEREKELIKVFGIEEFYKQQIKNLSGGQKQRFNAMISDLNNPQLLILDELTTGLDMKLQFQIINYFIATVEKEHQSLIIVSHRPDEVEALCNRAIIIHDGIVWFDDTVENIDKNYGGVKQLMQKYFDGDLKADPKANAPIKDFNPKQGTNNEGEQSNEKHKKRSWFKKHK